MFEYVLLNTSGSYFEKRNRGTWWELSNSSTVVQVPYASSALPCLHSKPTGALIL